MNQDLIENLNFLLSNSINNENYQNILVNTFNELNIIIEKKEFDFLNFIVNNLNDNNFYHKKSCIDNPHYFLKKLFTYFFENNNVKLFFNIALSKNNNDLTFLIKNINYFYDILEKNSKYPSCIFKFAYEKNKVLYAKLKEKKVIPFLDGSKQQYNGNILNIIIKDGNIKELKYFLDDIKINENILSKYFHKDNPAFLYFIKRYPNIKTNIDLQKIELSETILHLLKNNYPLEDKNLLLIFKHATKFNFLNQYFSMSYNDLEKNLELKKLLDIFDTNDIIGRSFLFHSIFKNIKKNNLNFEQVEKFFLFLINYYKLANNGQIIIYENNVCFFGQALYDNFQSEKTLNFLNKNNLFSFYDLNFIQNNLLTNLNFKLNLLELKQICNFDLNNFNKINLSIIDKKITNSKFGNIILNKLHFVNLIVYHSANENVINYNQSFLEKIILENNVLNNIVNIKNNKKLKL